jgi:hypothetical protein
MVIFKIIIRGGYVYFKNIQLRTSFLGYFLATILRNAIYEGQDLNSFKFYIVFDDDISRWHIQEALYCDCTTLPEYATGYIIVTHFRMYSKSKSCLLIIITGHNTDKV